MIILNWIFTNNLREHGQDSIGFAGYLEPSDSEVEYYGVLETSVSIKQSIMCWAPEVFNVHFIRYKVVVKCYHFYISVENIVNLM